MAEATVPTVSNEREISPMDLSLEQLNSLKVQHEEEIKELSKQLESLFGARNRYLNASNVINDYNKYASDDSLMIPLNSSLYVPGKIINNNKVMVELGTGYYCEKDLKGATDLINRKNQLVGSSIESVEKITTNKRKTLDQLVQVMQYKIQLMNQNN